MTNEIQPGFPLRASTLADQAVAVLVSLYGAPRTVGMLDTEEELRRKMQVSDEFRGLLGLDAP